MKKILIICACIPSAAFCAFKGKEFEHIEKFMNMEHKHKFEWLDNKKAEFDAEIDLAKKHKNEWFDLKKKQMEKFAKGGDASMNMGQELNDMIKMHEAQNNAWKEMCETNYKKDQEIARSHKAELDDFKKSINTTEKKSE